MTPSMLRVVIADDAEDIRFLLALRLRREGGFEVVGEACTGAEAIEAIDEFAPDVLVLDLAMPVMDGLEAIPEVKRRRPDCKIVILSGFEEELLAKKAIALGADAYLEKGAAMKELGCTIAKLYESEAVS